MKEIQTNGITILIVEVPEDAKEFDVHHNVLLCFHFNDDVEGINLPIGQYQILGKSTELSGEQMREICEECFGRYLDYKNPNLMGEAIAVWETVQESYLSLLEANGIVDRNEYGQIEPLWEPVCCGLPAESQGYPVCCGVPVPSEESVQLSDLWQEAQSKVKHYLVLKRI